MKKLIYNTLLFLVIASVFTACEKAEIKDGGGKTIIKIKGGGGSSVVLPLEISPSIEDIPILDLRRDAASSSDLNASATITLTNTQAYLDEYNAANGTDFELLPSDAYSITAGSAVTVSGDTWTLTLAPGEFVRNIFITLDKTKLDFSKQYGFGIQITQTTQGAASLENGFAVINPIVKNQYHGSYHSTGVFHHPSAGDRAIDEDKELITSGLTSVRAPLGDLGGAGYYMILNVNPDNTVTISPSGATPDINQSYGPNYYDPATKAFNLHYSYNTSAPRIIEEEIKLK